MPGAKFSYISCLLLENVLLQICISSILPSFPQLLFSKEHCKTLEPIFPCSNIFHFYGFSSKSVQKMLLIFYWVLVTVPPRANALSSYSQKNTVKKGPPQGSKSYTTKKIYSAELSSSLHNFMQAWSQMLLKESNLVKSKDKTAWDENSILQLLPLV